MGQVSHERLIALGWQRQGITFPPRVRVMHPHYYNEAVIARQAFEFPTARGLIHKIREGIRAEGDREGTIPKRQRRVCSTAHVLSLRRDPMLGNVELKERVVDADDGLALRALHQAISQVPATTGQLQDWFLRLPNEAPQGQGD